MKALIIRSPWIDLILAGKKTWEMRSRATNIRGRIALIKAGSGMVYGTAELLDCLPALDSGQMRINQNHHGIPESAMASALANNWTTPWVLRDIRLLKAPVPYKHPSGAVTWVDLHNFTEEALVAKAPESKASVLKAVAPNAKATTATAANEQTQSAARSCASAKVFSGQWVDISLTQGNLNHNHFYLREALSLLPEDCIGGKNKAQLRHPIQVTFQNGQTVETDVDGAKMILRRRSPVGDFFVRTGCVAGDTLRFTRLGEREFHVARIGRQ